MFLGAFAKLRIATVSCDMSVRPSFRMEQLGSEWTDFHDILHLRIFRKSDSNTLHADRYTFLIISRSILHIMKNVPDKSCTENQNTHFEFGNFLFRKSCRL